MFCEGQSEPVSCAVVLPIMAVSTNGYYAWLKRLPSRRVIEDKLLLAEIRRVQADSYESYGYRRILQALIALCHKVDRDRVARLMRQSDIVAKSERTVQIHDSRYQNVA